MADFTEDTERSTDCGVRARDADIRTPLRILRKPHEQGAVTPTPAAARARRHRERQRAGLKVFAVAVDHYAAVDTLIRAGYLSEEKAADDAETAQALQKFFTDGIKRKRHA